MKEIINSIMPDLKASTRALKVEFVDSIKENLEEKKEERNSGERNNEAINAEIKTEKYGFGLEIEV